MCMILLFIIIYEFTWRGLVSTSAHIYSEVQPPTGISPLLITSFTKKYLPLICLVFFKLDFFPFIIRRMVLWLSWNMMFLSTVYTCPWIKYSVHTTGPIISLTTMSLMSVEIRTLIFCFHNPILLAPAPRDIMPPVCPRQSSYVENDVSTHKFITESMSAFKISLNPNAPLMYFITRFRFAQSSLSGAFIILVRKGTAICKS